MSIIKKSAISVAFGLTFMSAIYLGFLHPILAPSVPVITQPPLVEDPAPVLHELAFENTTKVVDGQQIVTNTDSLLVLVNKDRSLPADYIPTDLAIPDVLFSFGGNEPRKSMRTEAARALEELFADAKNFNIRLVAASGYRSYATQTSVFANWAKQVGEVEARKTVALPGQSEHQTGLAMDVTNSTLALSEAFGSSKEGIWVAENAHRFGFIIRYPQGKEHITGYSYEPWHLRYVGREVAEDLYLNELTLEEYFQLEYGY